MISDALIDKSFYIRGQAENAADDIAVFVPTLNDKICEMSACLTDKNLESAAIARIRSILVAVATVLTCYPTLPLTQMLSPFWATKLYLL